jgi:Skp family chaperone for outer membrane proteins
MKSFVVGLVSGLALVAGQGIAAAQQAPASQAPAQPQPQPQAQAPRPFPEGAKMAVIDIQRVASDNQKKIAELNELNKKLQADQQKLQTSGAMLNEQARAELERGIDRQQKELQRAQQDAQDEVQQLQQDLQNTFQAKLFPVIQKVVQEKGIQILFSHRDAGIVYVDPGLDLTAEVIKRFDAATGTQAPATAAPAAPAKPQ